MRSADTALARWSQIGRTNSGCAAALAATVGSNATPAKALSNVGRETPRASASGQSVSKNPRNAACRDAVILLAAAALAENATPDRASATRKARSRLRAALPTEGDRRR